MIDMVMIDQVLKNIYLSSIRDIVPGAYWLEHDGKILQRDGDTWKAVLCVRVGDDRPFGVVVIDALTIESLRTDERAFIRVLRDEIFRVARALAEHI